MLALIRLARCVRPHRLGQASVPLPWQWCRAPPGS